MNKLIILALLLVPVTASAQTVLHSPPLWCEVGGQSVLLQGMRSTNEVQRSIPSCNVRVYNAGTLNNASIFSDSLATPTPKANPFSALANGKIDFYAAAACYDIVTSGGTGSDTFPTPITYFGVCFGGSGGGGGGGGGSVTSVGFSAPAGFSVSGSPVTGVGTLALSMPSGWTDQDLLIGNGANSVTRLPKGADDTCLTLDAGIINWGAGPCVGIPAGTTNQIVKRTDGPNSILGDSSLFDDGANPVQAPNGLSVMSNGLPRVIVNANPATTVLNQLVERNASGLAINASLSSLRALGVAGQNAGVNSAALQVTSVGYGTCVFDGTTVINDYVVPSATTAGLCHDAGATRPLNSEVMGTVTTVNSGAATTAIVDFFTGDTSQTTPSAIAPCGSSPGPFAYYTAASTLGCDILMLTDGAGNGTMSSLTLGGASAGYLFFTASSQPSFPVANSAYLFAPATIPTTYALKLPQALGTAGQALVITGVSSNVATLGFSAAAGCPEGTCIINAPAANQVIVGAHKLINSAGGIYELTNASATPSDSVLDLSMNSSGQGSIAYNATGATVNTAILFNPSGTIAMNPKATGADDGAHGVVINNSGLYVAGSFADNNAITVAAGNVAIAGAGASSNVITLGSTGVEGIIGTVPPSGGGTYTIRSPTTGLTNVINWPNSSGTLANIVGGILTTPNLTLSAITGSTQCLHVNTSGVVSGTAGDCATGGSGTVTSIATTSPITGGTITTTGTIACATCVVASSPGLGLAHFAGSTQTVTSSLVVNADITAATIDLTTKVTGILPSANGGTANAFFTVSGPATSAKTFTFPNSSATVLTSASAVTVAQGGTGLTSGTSGGIPAYTGATTISSSGVLTTNVLIKGGGAGAAPAPSLFTDNGTTATYTGSGGILAPTVLGIVDASQFSGTHWTDKVVTAYGSSQCSSGCTIIIPDSIADNGAPTTPTIPSNVTLQFTGSATFTGCVINIGKFTKIYNHDALLQWSGSSCGIKETVQATLQQTDTLILQGLRIDCNLQATSTGIAIGASTAQVSLRDIRVANCKNGGNGIGINAQGVQFAEIYNVETWNNDIGAKWYSIVTTGGGNSLNIYGRKSVGDTVGDIIINQSAAFPQTSIYYIDPTFISDTICGMAVFGDTSVAQTDVHWIGGAPESNASGAATVVIDGKTVKRSAIYANQAVVYLHDVFVADAAANPEFLAETNSTIHASNLRGYGCGTCNLIQTDSTSTSTIEGTTELIGSVQNVVGYPTNLSNQEAGQFFGMYGAPLLTYNQKVPNAWTSGNPQTPAFADITGASSQATATDAIYGLVNTVTFAASAGSKNTNRARLGNLITSATAVTSDILVSLLIKCSVNASVAVGDFNLTAQSGFVLVNCRAGQWTRAVTYETGIAAGTGNTYMLFANDSTGATVSVTGVEALALPAGSVSQQQGMGIILSTGAVNPNGSDTTKLTTGTSVTLTAPRQYFVCTGTCTVTPPVPAAGDEFCVMNDDNVATVITLAALGSSASYENSARTAYGTAGTGTFVSGGAVGDKVCIVGRDATHYLTVSFNGTWVAN